MYHDRKEKGGDVFHKGDGIEVGVKKVLKREYVQHKSAESGKRA